MLIEASFAQQYGIRLRQENNMPWTEFSTLLAGLNEDTALGRAVQIRAESRQDIVKMFTPQQRKIRSDWRRSEARRMHKNNPQEAKRKINEVQELFKSMFGGNS